MRNTERERDEGKESEGWREEGREEEEEVSFEYNLETQ